MTNNVYINEIRLPLESLLDLSIIRYRSSKLSSGHRKRLESVLSIQHGIISIFEGDILFCIPSQTDLASEKQRLIEILQPHIRGFKNTDLANVLLRNIPERVVERLIFAVIARQAAKQGIYSAFGRSFFKPTKQEGLLAHRVVDLTLQIEDGVAKLHLVPSFLALTAIDNSKREEFEDLELLGLCQFRTKCPKADSVGVCTFFQPGQIGYYAGEIPLASMPDDNRSKFLASFDGCPKLPTVEEVILVKATRKATKQYAYPKFMLTSRFSRVDLQSDPQLNRKYRDATLMNSSDRLKETVKWTREILDIDENAVPNGKVNLTFGTKRVALEFGIMEPLPIGVRIKHRYSALAIPEQRVIADKQRPQPLSYGGGWCFTSYGAYDRQDSDRPFSSVRPYLIVPNVEPVIAQTRKLFSYLSDGQYISRARSDQDFLGVNHPDSKKKYGTTFVNLWDIEEDIYLTSGTVEDYIQKAEDIKRDINRNEHRDPNRIVMIVAPSSVDSPIEDSLYHKIKKIFLEEGIPCQVVTQENLEGIDRETTAFGPILHSLWLNIYTKMGGKPWRLANELGNVHCFIGVGFGLNPKQLGNHIYAGVAHVFDKYGSWIDVASNWQNLSDEDRASLEGEQKYLQGTSSFKISENLTRNIVYEALKLYQQNQTKTQVPPKNIVLHKLGQVYECEIIGFLEGVTKVLGTLDECHLGILQIEQDHSARLYGDEHIQSRNDNRTVFRGTELVITDKKVVLATSGRTPRNPQRYFGIGTPQPLMLTSCQPSDELLAKYRCNTNQFYDVVTLSRHVMALTQLHWGSIRDNIRLPITALYAQKVADLISKTGAKVNSWALYHRPWFL